MKPDHLALKFPDYFNPVALPLWYEACRELPENQDEAWVVAITNFRLLCWKSKVNPLLENGTSNNDALRSLMLHQRQLLVTFMNLTKFMQGIPIIRQIQKKVWPVANGFKVEVKAQVRIDDPTWAKHLKLIQPRRYRFNLMREHSKYYVSHISPGLTVFVYNDAINNPQRWHIGYWLTCPIPPDLGTLDPHNFEWFVLYHLWDPVTRKLRAKKLHPIRYI